MILNLEELNRRWDTFVVNTKINTANIQNFNESSSSIRSITLWLYELHRLGAIIWNNFVKFNISEYGNFELDLSGNTFTQNFNFKEFHFINANFSNCRFENEISFNKAQFHNLADFSNTEFLKKTDFSEVNFNNTDFSASIFHSKVDFSETIFNEISFFQTKFLELVNFSKAQFFYALDFSNDSFSNSEAYFIGTKFLKRVDFNNFAFLQTDFSKAEFCQKAYFLNTTFKEDTRFVESKFSKKVIFSKSTFKGNCDFYRTLLLAGADFVGSTFEKNSNFYEQQLGNDKSTKLKFNYAKFKGEANFYNYNLNHYINFNNATFEQLPEFELLGNNNSDFLNFSNVKISFSGSGFDNWTTDVNVLNKLHQLNYFAWNIKNKDLKNRIFTLTKLANRGIQFRNSFELLGKFLRNKKSANKKVSLWQILLKLFLLPLITTIWLLKLFFWPLQQILLTTYSTISDYGRSYLRPLIFLLLSYPCFYLLHQQLDNFNSCQSINPYFFVLNQYFPFSNHFTIFNFQNCLIDANYIFYLNIGQIFTLFIYLLLTFLPFGELFLKKQYPDSQYALKSDNIINPDQSEPSNQQTNKNIDSLEIIRAIDSSLGLDKIQKMNISDYTKNTNKQSNPFIFTGQSNSDASEQIKPFTFTGQSNSDASEQIKPFTFTEKSNNYFPEILQQTDRKPENFTHLDNHYLGEKKLNPTLDNSINTSKISLKSVLQDYENLNKKAVNKKIVENIENNSPKNNNSEAPRPTGAISEDWPHQLVGGNTSNPKININLDFDNVSKKLAKANLSKETNFNFSLPKSNDNNIEKKVSNKNTIIENDKKNLKKVISDISKEIELDPKIDLPNDENKTLEQEQAPKIDLPNNENKITEQEQAPKIDLPNNENKVTEQAPTIDLPDENKILEQEQAPKIDLPNDENKITEQEQAPKIDLPNDENKITEQEQAPKIDLPNDENKTLKQEQAPKIDLPNDENKIVEQEQAPSINFIIPENTVEPKDLNEPEIAVPDNSESETETNPQQESKKESQKANSVFDIDTKDL